MDESAEKKYWENVENVGEVKRLPSHPVVKFFSNQRIEYMANYIDLKNIKNALDVGCGTGFSSFHFPKSINMTGIDFSFRNLVLNPLKNKIQASTYCLPFRSESFDLVYGWDFLHHLDSPLKAIFEMMRLTKKYLVLFEPNRNNPIQYLYGLLNVHERGTLEFNKKKLIELASTSGLKIIHSDSIGWVFAGASPNFSINIIKHLPFSHPLAISSVVICKKVEKSN